ncbi:MAG: hypothetical protein WBE72_15860 [Terracidiphilus sp.]
MRKFLIAICLLGISCAAQAQGKPASWQNLKALQAGEKIEVREMNSTKVTGTFLNFSDAAISLEAEAGPRTIQTQDVRSVKRMRNKHRLRNTLILAGVGAGAGAGIGAALHHPCPATQSFCFDIGGRALPAGIGAVAGFLGGAAVGALLPTHETIYSVGPH